MDDDRELLKPWRWDWPRWNAAIACWLGIYLLGFLIGLAILDADWCPEWMEDAFVVGYFPVLVLVALVSGRL